MSELKIVATIIIKPEYKNELIPIFQTVVNETRQEAGCISYEVHEDVKDSSKIVFVEIWKNQDAIDSHNASQHFKNFVVGIDGKIKDLKIDILKKII